MGKWAERLEFICVVETYVGKLKSIFIYVHKQHTYRLGISESDIRLKQLKSDQKNKFFCQ